MTNTKMGMGRPIYHYKNSCSWTFQSLNFKKSYGATFDREFFKNILEDCILFSLQLKLGFGKQNDWKIGCRLPLRLQNPLQSILYGREYLSSYSINLHEIKRFQVRFLAALTQRMSIAWFLVKLDCAVSYCELTTGMVLRLSKISPWPSESEKGINYLAVRLIYQH
jgi:hypothetical protein